MIIGKHLLLDFEPTSLSKEFLLNYILWALTLLGGILTVKTTFTIIAG